MTNKLKIQLSQIDITVGDLEGNFTKILQEYQKANQENCDLVVFPEMAICGYDCKDLWLKKYFILKQSYSLIYMCSLTTLIKEIKCFALLIA